MLVWVAFGKLPSEVSSTVILAFWGTDYSKLQEPDVFREMTRELACWSREMAPLLKTLQWWSGALGWEVLGSAQTLKPPAWSPLKSLFLAFMTGCSAFDQGPDHQPFSLKFKKKRQIDLGKQTKWGFCLRALLSFFFLYWGIASEQFCVVSGGQWRDSAMHATCIYSPPNPPPIQATI